MGTLAVGRPSPCDWGVAVLNVIGLPAEAETVYEVLLEGGAATAGQLATLTGLTPHRARSALRELATRGLVGQGPGRPAHYTAIDPGVALDLLLLRRREEIRQARNRVQELSERFHHAEASQEQSQLVEILTGRETIQQRVWSAQRRARRELRTLDKPPYATRPDADPAGGREYLLEQGGTVRNIYERASVEMPGRITGDIRSGSARGEQDRVLPELPTKLVLVDDRLAILPVATPALDSAIIVHHPALLSALAALFENLWQVALPLETVALGAGHAARAAHAAQAGQPSQEERNILALLTTGLPDDAVARQLGLSDRTYQRRIHDMMERLGARTRFQLARHAGRRGWLTDDENQA